MFWKKRHGCRYFVMWRGLVYCRRDSALCAVTPQLRHPAVRHFAPGIFRRNDSQTMFQSIIPNGRFLNVGWIYWIDLLNTLSKSVKGKCSMNCVKYENIKNRCLSALLRALPCGISPFIAPSHNYIASFQVVLHIYISAIFVTSVRSKKRPVLYSPCVKCRGWRREKASAELEHENY